MNIFSSLFKQKDNSEKELILIQKDLDSQLLKSKIGNTIGTVTTIAGPALFATSWAVGLCLSALGFGISLSSSIYKKFSVRSADTKIYQITGKIIGKSDTSSKIPIEVLKNASNLCFFSTKVRDLLKMRNFSSGYKVAYNGVHGAVNAMKTAAKFSKFITCIVIFGNVTSTIDILQDWKTKNETSEQLKNLILNKKRENNEKKKKIVKYILVLIVLFLCILYLR